MQAGRKARDKQSEAKPKGDKPVAKEALRPAAASHRSYREKIVPA